MSLRSNFEVANQGRGHSLRNACQEQTSTFHAVYFSEV